MNTTRIAQRGLLAAAALLLLAAGAWPQATGYIYSDTAAKGTFNDQLDALVESGVNDILIQGPHTYLVEPVVVPVTVNNVTVDRLVLSGVSSAEACEIVLSDDTDGQVAEDPDTFSFPLYQRGDTGLPYNAGCVQVTVVKWKNAIDGTITYDATFEVAYHAGNLAGQALTLDFLDRLTGIVSKRFVVANLLGSNATGSFTVEWLGMSQTQGEDLLAGQYAARLTTADPAEFLQGDVIQSTCSLAPFNPADPTYDYGAIWTFPLDTVLDPALDPAPSACITAKIANDGSYVEFNVEYRDIDDLSEIQVIDGADAVVKSFTVADVQAGNLNSPVRLMWNITDQTTELDPLLAESLRMRLVTLSHPGGEVEGKIQDSSCETTWSFPLDQVLDPALNPAPSGCVSMSLAWNKASVHFVVSYQNIDDLTEVQILDPADAVIKSFDATESLTENLVSPVHFVWTFSDTATERDPLLAGQFRMRLVTRSHAGGEVAGAILDLDCAGFTDIHWSFPLDQVLDPALNPVPSACVDMSVPQDQSYVRFLVAYENIDDLTEIRVLDATDTVIKSFSAADATFGNLDSPVHLIWTIADPATELAPLLAGNFWMRLVTTDHAGGEVEGRIDDARCSTLAETVRELYWSFPLDQVLDSTLDPPPTGCVSMVVTWNPVLVRFLVSYEGIGSLERIDVVDSADAVVESFTISNTDPPSLLSPVGIRWRILDEVAYLVPLLTGEYRLRLVSTATGAGAIEGQITDSSCSHITPPPPVVIPPGTMFTVDDGGTLVLENLTLYPKDVGIRVYPGGAIELNKIYIRDAGRYGVDFIGGGTSVPSGVFLNCAIVRCGEDGILAADGTLTIQQSSFIDNTGAGISLTNPDIILNAVASLFCFNAIDIEGTVDATPVNDNFVATGCWFVEGSGKDHTADISIFDEFLTSYLPPSAQIYVPDNMFDPNACWRGRLNPIAVAFFMLPEWSLILGTPLDADDLPLENEEDLESDLRENEVKQFIGADEPGNIGASGLGDWADCDVITPNLPLGGGASPFGGGAVAACGDPIEVRIQTWDLDLSTGAVIHVICAGGTIANDSLVSPVPVQVSPISVYAGIATFNAPPSLGLCNGLVEILLEVTGVGIFGRPLLDVANNRVTPAAEAGRFFMIDCIPPAAADCDGDPATLDNTVHSSNDILIAPAPLAQYPSDWAGVVPVPRSQGSMVDPNRDPEFFFNLDDGDIRTAPTPLDFTISVCFVDQGVGFADQSFQPSGTFPGAQAMYDVLTNPFATTTPPAGAVGTVWWDLNEVSLQTLILSQPDTASVAISSSVVPADVSPDGYPRLNMSYAFSGMEYVSNNWHLVASFIAQDLAGNITVIPRQVHVWWYPNDPWVFQHVLRTQWWLGYAEAGAILTVDPGGNETPNPVITWDIARAAGPVDAYPAYPIARFRLRRLDGNNLVPLRVSPWFRQRTIDRFTVVDNTVSPPVRLGDLLDQPANLGKRIIIEVVAADEAGNVEPFPTNAFADATTSWINSGQSSSLETTIQPHYWHNETQANVGNQRSNPFTVDPNIGEIDFGASTRIPLTDFCTHRVEAAFEVTAGVVGAQSGTLRIDWEFFEDGIRVASGSMVPTSGATTNRATLTIPTEFLNPGLDTSKQLTVQFYDPATGNVVNTQAFLNHARTACGAVQDRLGDDGNTPDDKPPAPYRQRDVEYVFTARTVVTTPDGLQLSDTSPASVSFIVYADREIGTTDPIKQYVRE